MTLPFYTGQVPTADDFNELAIKSELSASSGATKIGYGGTTVAAVLAGITAPVVLSVAGRVGNVTLSYGDVSGTAQLTGDSTQNFSVKNATGAQHAIPLVQADARYAAFGSTGTGTVTSVSLALPSELNVSGSPVTNAGTLAASWANQSAAKILASPASTTGTPVFRALVPTDIPTLNQNTSGTAAGLSATLVPSRGGTGQATLQAAIDALTDVVSAGNEFVFTKDTATGHGMFKPGGGSSSFVQAGAGAITRTMQNKVRESVSVKDFGALGDGTTDDTAACQAAINSLSTTGGCVYFPTGRYRLTATLTMPAVNLELRGDGDSSCIFGSSNLITYPVSTYDGSGKVAIQSLYNLRFDQTGNGVSVYMGQTWDSGGKLGPEIASCSFLNSNASTTTAVGILLTGVWAASIHDCRFIGGGSGGGPTSGIGGYGIKTAHTSNFNTSVMNVIIANNTFITLAWPIFMAPRTVVSGGRVEGMKIIGNNMAAGNVAITSNATLATTVTGNQLSDYSVGYYGVADFDLSIVGNSEITGNVSGINLLPNVDGLCERVTITGNNISGAGGIGIRLSNTINDDWLRCVTITGNSFRGTPGSFVGYGIAFEGSKTINAISFNGNSFHWLQTGYWFSGLAHSRNWMSGNVFTNVTTPATNFVSSGTSGGQVSVAGRTRALIQIGSDTTGAAPVITFPIPFKAGTQPTVTFVPMGTSNSTMEAPAISNITNTFVEIQKKQTNGSSIFLANYTVGWTAIGEVDG